MNLNKIGILLLILTVNYNIMAQELSEKAKYIELDVLSMVKELEKNNKKLNAFDYQIPENGVLVYKIEDGRIILLPGNVSTEEKGLILNDEGVLKEMLENDFFPVEVSEKSPLESHSERLKNLPENIDYYVNFLEQELGIDILSLDIYNSDFFERFDKAISYCNLGKRADEFFMPLVITLGMIINKNKGGYWKVTKEYSLYNPYYLPSVVLNDIELDVSNRILADLSNPQYYSLRQSYQFLTDPKINPLLNPNTKNIYKNFLDNQ